MGEVEDLLVASGSIEVVAEQDIQRIDFDVGVGLKKEILVTL